MELRVPEAELILYVLEGGDSGMSIRPKHRAPNLEPLKVLRLRSSAIPCHEYMKRITYTSKNPFERKP